GSYKWMYSVDEVGFKYNGNSIMAAIALVELGRLDDGNRRRRQLAALYRDALGDIGGLHYIAHRNEGESSRHLIQFVAEGRNELIEFLADRGVGTGVHYRSNARYPMYAHNQVPFANDVDGRIISLPCHLKLADDDVTHVVDAIKAFYRQS
ncbi:MAG TPA: DegT/DnrJ/EryC1/StrS family aminotransferase, partial [Magnetospirillum sp.]|nr:DegT/DnrJ/EryC1/StrS family aminotransferase [Magnetospirillum sp.]